MIDTDELLTLMTHRGKMFLLSRVLDYDLEKRALRAEFDVTEDCLFFDPALGGVPAWAAFEFMAQSISALSGLARRAEGKPPKPGVILKVSRMEIFQSVIKTKALIEVRLDFQFDALFTFNCSAHSDGLLCAEANLTVMDVEDITMLVRRASE